MLWVSLARPSLAGLALFVVRSSALRSVGSWHQRNPSKTPGFVMKVGSLLIGPDAKQMCVPVGRRRPSESVRGSLTMRWKDTGYISRLFQQDVRLESTHIHQAVQNAGILAGNYPCGVGHRTTPWWHFAIHPLGFEQSPPAVDSDTPVCEPDHREHGTEPSSWCAQRPDS